MGTFHSLVDAWFLMPSFVCDIHSGMYTAPPCHTHTKSRWLILDRSISGESSDHCYVQTFSPTGPSHPRSPVSCWSLWFLTLFWILHPGNPILCPEFGLEEKQSKNWTDICKGERKNFLPPVYSGVVISPMSTTVLEVRQRFCENQASLTVAVFILKGLWKMKKLPIYVFELDSLKPSVERNPICLSVLTGTGREEGGLEWGVHCPRAWSNFLLMKMVSVSQVRWVKCSWWIHQRLWFCGASVRISWVRRLLNHLKKYAINQW